MWRRVVVVVPCFNETSRLRLDLFEGHAGEEPDTGFLFVDDGSTDGTGELIAQASAAAPEHFRALSLPKNLGKAEAVRLGLLEALGLEARIVAYWDADLATPLSELPGMLERMEGEEEVEGVLGSRVRLLGRSIHRRPLRHYLGRLFATAASVALRLPVYDTQCGAKVFAATENLAESLKNPFLSRWVFDVELLGRLTLQSNSGAPPLLEEYPVMHWTDVSGSKVRFSDFLKAGFDLLSLWRWLAKARGGRVRGR